MKALLLGDLSPTRTTNPLFEKEDVNALFGDTVSLFEGNDINLVNLECALTDSENRIKKFGPNLKAAPQTASVMKTLGINYCGLSNNHIFDFGIPGALDTITCLDEAGIGYTGFGRDYDDSRTNLVIEQGDERVCIIAVCEHEYSYALEDRMGSRPYDEYDTLADIRKAKQDCTRVIVLYHGGKEHCAYPSPRLYRACHAMADSGADVILCQHSHCIGCYEEYNDCHILYGQGNFHFIYSDRPNLAKGWYDTLAVRYDTATDAISFVPLTTVGDSMVLASGEKKAEIMDAFELRNASLKDGSWKQGWHAFCESMRDVYEEVIRDGGDKFGHYLDCEAHTDVWRELFPTYNQTNERESVSPDPGPNQA